MPANSAPTPIRTALQIDAGSASVTRVEVSIPSGFTNGLAVDDVEFSTAGPPPTCSATAVPTVRLSLPAEGALVRANEFSLQGTVDNRGAPVSAATVERDSGGGARSLFPSGIGPNGGSFGPIRVTDLLVPGAQKVVKATNCRGTGSTQVGVFWCRNNAPLAGSARVSTLAELKEALTSCKKDVWVENNARIDLAAVGDNRSGAPNYVVHVPDGVTLASGRSPTEEGGLLYMSRRLLSQPHMLDLGSNTRVTGLRLRGYDLTKTNNASYTATVAIYIDAIDILVENNEIFGWPTAAVEVPFPEHRDVGGAHPHHPELHPQQRLVRRRRLRRRHRLSRLRLHRSQRLRLLYSQQSLRAQPRPPCA